MDEMEFVEAANNVKNVIDKCTDISQSKFGGDSDDDNDNDDGELVMMMMMIINCIFLLDLLSM